jgi:hypothetical protein
LTGENRASHFDCPNCGTKVRFTNAYPLSFQWKVCPKCRWQWIPLDWRSELGPHADSIVGQTNRLRLASSGRSVDDNG